MLGFGRRSFARRGRTQVRPAFVATDLAGCVLWLVAGRGMVLDVSNNVQQWNDLSGAGNNVSQATSTQRPAFGAASGPNGLPGVTFAAATFDRLVAAGQFANANNFTAIMAVRLTSTATAGAVFCPNLSVDVRVGTTGKRDILLNGIEEDLDTTSNATTNWELWTVTSSVAPLRTLRVNGVAHTLSPNSGTPPANSGAGRVGSGDADGNCVINSVACWNRVLTAAEIAEYESAERYRTAIF